jgi:hypothetical protein
MLEAATRDFRIVAETAVEVFLLKKSLFMHLFQESTLAAVR